jgi:hypothetical protein
MGSDYKYIGITQGCFQENIMAPSEKYIKKPQVFFGGEITETATRTHGESGSQPETPREFVLNELVKAFASLTLLYLDEQYDKKVDEVKAKEDISKIDAFEHPPPSSGP